MSLPPYTAQVRSSACAAITRLKHRKAIDEAWAAWLAARDPGLSQALTSLFVPAVRPAETRLYSLLLLAASPIYLKEPDLIPALLTACHDVDPTLAEHARASIRQIKHQGCIDALCRLWVEQRIPEVEQLILTVPYRPTQPVAVCVTVALLQNDPATILGQGGEVIPPLAAAVLDGDRRIQTNAEFCLHNLSSQNAIDALCALWRDSRDPLLESALSSARYLPAHPPDLRLLVGLKNSYLSQIQEIASALAKDLIDFLEDPDQEVQVNAALMISSASAPLQDAICALFTQSEDMRALKICRERNFLPSSPEQRSLFLLLSEQWDNYLSFDYNCNLLNIYYSTAPEATRRAIVSKIQKSARPDLLRIMVGDSLRYTRRETDAAEIATLLRVLEDQKDLARLWQLIFDLPVMYAGQILTFLTANRFQPETTGEQHLIADLAALDLFPEPPATIELPLGLLVSRFRVAGRINEIAFHPRLPQLAIGTGSRKVVIWDYQKARVAAVVKGLAHSISQIAYGSDGTLYFGERTSTRQECRIYQWQDERLTVIGSHQGDVTAIEPISPGAILTAGKDAQLKLFRDQNVASMVTLPFWPRSVSVSGDRTTAAAAAMSLAVYEVPALRVSEVVYRKPRGKNIRKSMVTASTFAHGVDALLVGQHNGQVLVCPHATLSSSLPALLPYEFSKPVRSLQFDPNKNLLLAASSTAEVQAFSWPTLQALDAIRSDSDSRMNTFHLSPDSSILAIGEDETSCALWDFRIDEVRRLIAQPLASLTPADLALVNSFLQYPGLQPPIAACLKALQLLLRSKFRNDIFVEETGSIQPGEYDIILDSEIG